MWQNIKLYRVIISTVYFCCLLFLFIDFSHSVPTWIVNVMTWLQVAPSLINFISGHQFWSTGFVAIIILTLFFGRVYCSFLCPLGTLQDIIIHVAGKIKLTSGFVYLKRQKILPELILIVSVIPMFAGISVIFGLVEPYSVFGRISYTAFRPVYLNINNFVTELFSTFSGQTQNLQQFKVFNQFEIVIVLVTLILIIWLSVKKGRQYCNLICPVGISLGWLSRLSIFKLTFGDVECGGCKLCEQNCKAACIDSKNKKIDFERCIACFNCLNICAQNGITYKSSFDKIIQSTKNKKDESRRKLFVTIGIFLFGVAYKALAQTDNNLHVSPDKPLPQKKPVSPPGSVSIKHLLNVCTLCNLCVNECPTKVLQPAFLEYGFKGFLMPVMNFDVAYCNYQCNACTQVCPTGALISLKPTVKKITQIGLATFNKSDCVVVTNDQPCDICKLRCPTKAINQVKYKNAALPEINCEICNGCGTCEFYCPALPNKAIFVIGNSVHKLIRLPMKKDLEKNLNVVL